MASWIAVILSPGIMEMPETGIYEEISITSEHHLRLFDHFLDIASNIYNVAFIDYAINFSLYSEARKNVSKQEGTEREKKENKDKTTLS